MKGQKPVKRFFTLRQAKDQLHITDYRTLSLWMARTGVKPTVFEYGDGSKARGKYLTAKQIDRIRTCRVQFKHTSLERYDL